MFRPRINLPVARGAVSIEKSIPDIRISGISSSAERHDGVGICVSRIDIDIHGEALLLRSGHNDRLTRAGHNRLTDADTTRPYLDIGVVSVRRPINMFRL